jgi:hypothetical protein
MVIDRKVLTVLDCLSMVGGLMGIAFGVMRLLVSDIQKNLFIQSVIKRIFFEDGSFPEDQPKQRKKKKDVNTNVSNSW